MKRSTKKQILSLLILVAFLGSSVTYAVISAVPTDNSVQSNWAARIDIVVDNQLYPIPAGIGIYSNNTTAKLFTTNANDIIYKTGSESVTVREFFSIWNKTFNSTCVLDYCNSANASMRMYVNNAENFQYDSYAIKSGDYILIDYRQIFTLPTPTPNITENATNTTANQTLNSTDNSST
jgi:hypothetical protein